MEKDFIIDILQKQIQAADLIPKGEEIGRVVSVGDGIVSIEGLPNCMFSETVFISSWPADADEIPVPALVLNLQEYLVEAVVLGDDTQIHEGDIVKRTDQVLAIPVGEQLLGRVVSPLGKALDGKGAILQEGMVM